MRQVVASDELDTGLRNVLNLGHTVGHAIESATGYTAYRHGEAVGLGLLAALRLSDAERAARPRSKEPPRPLTACRRRLEVPLEVDVVIDALSRDKKRTARGVGFVLLAEPGEPGSGSW